MSVAEWADMHGVHHRRIVWSSYGKLAWVGFEPTAEQYKNVSCIAVLIYSSIYLYNLKIISLEPVLNADYCRIYFILVLTSIKEEIAK